MRAFLDGDSDRRRTAESLGVHPDTVDNRLTRALELTGVDPRTTRGVQLCSAALTLRPASRTGRSELSGRGRRVTTETSGERHRAAGTASGEPIGSTGPAFRPAAPGAVVQRSRSGAPPGRRKRWMISRRVGS